MSTYKRRITKSRLKQKQKRLRLSVFRSNLHIVAQIIDQEAGKTMVYASSLKIKKGNKMSKAAEVGTQVSKMAQEKGIKEVVFDRGPYEYKGRVRALAESARKSGLLF
ncbi:MAG: 50S ribosomal protein L18 [Candidatus Margulisbacteria bacterium]|nr:50S ribosomal protein L18 [Candidatus Margulisiibacteriota bacterium]